MSYQAGKSEVSTYYMFVWPYSHLFLYYKRFHTYFISRVEIWENNNNMISSSINVIIFLRLVNAFIMFGWRFLGHGGLAWPSHPGKSSCPEEAQGWIGSKHSEISNPGKKVQVGERNVSGSDGSGLWRGCMGDTQRESEGRMSLLFAFAIMKESNCPLHGGMPGGVVARLG